MIRKILCALGWHGEPEIWDRDRWRLDFFSERLDSDAADGSAIPTYQMTCPLCRRPAIGWHAIIRESWRAALKAWNENRAPGGFPLEKSAEIKRARRESWQRQLDDFVRAKRPL